MAAISGNLNTKSAWPTLFPCPCGGDVLIVESNYDITAGIFGEKNCSLPELSENFLLKHTTIFCQYQLIVNFNNPFGENLILRL